MTNQERRDAQLPYISDETVYNEQKRARILTQKLNTMDRSDFDGIAAVVRELLQTEENAFINPPFYCDYGNHIEVGKNFFANYNCTILDVSRVTFGDNCMLAPNVAIYSAGHPVHPDSRNSAYEYGIDVTIGSNCVIGAGSVVTKDIPAWSIAAGNPCRVLRRITEEDRKYYFRDREFDEESWAAICGREKK